MTKVICKKSLKAVVIITDGYSSDDVTLPSIELRDMGTTVVSVGFGEETPYMKYALEAMASDPKDQHRLIFDYGDLMEGVSQVSAVICQGLFCWISLTNLTWIRMNSCQYHHLLFCVKNSSVAKCHISY